MADFVFGHDSEDSRRRRQHSVSLHKLYKDYVPSCLVMPFVNYTNKALYLLTSLHSLKREDRFQLCNHFTHSLLLKMSSTQANFLRRIQTSKFGMLRLNVIQVEHSIMERSSTYVGNELLTSTGRAA